MKKRFIRLITLVVAVAFLVTGFAGCGGKQPEPKQEGEKAPAASGESSKQEAANGKQVEISRLYRMAAETFPAETTPIEKEIEQKFNVKLKRISAPTANYEEKLSALVASGDIPDIFTIMEINQMVKFAKDGVIGDLKGVINEKDHPNFYKWINDPKYKPYVAYDGGIYGLPNINTYTTAPWVPLIRKDWLAELNLKMPETLADLYNVAKEFKAKKNVYPIGACNGFDYDNLNFILGAFGVVYGSWHTEGDKIVSYDVSPKMKEALAFLRKLKADGLLDPDWSTQKEEPMFDKLINGKTGILQTWSVYHWRKEWNIAQVEMIKAGKLKKEDKFDETKLYGNENTTYLDYMPVLKGPDGQAYGLRGQAPVFDRHAISKKAVSDPEKIKRIMQLAEWSSTDEGYLLTRRGHKDEHYTVDANGYIVRKPGIDEQTTARVAGMEWWNLAATFNEKIDPPGDLDKPYDMKIRNYSKTLPTLERAEDFLTSETFGKKRNEVKAKRDEVYFKIVNGSLPVEAFDKWVEDFKAMGYDTMAKEFTDSYNAMKK